MRGRSVVETVSLLTTRHVWLTFLFGVLEASASPTSGYDVVINGAGASFPSDVYRDWILSYSVERNKHLAVLIKYESIGSSGGKARITNVDGPPVDFAGSDSLMSAKQMQEFPDLKMFPTMAGAVVMGYNLPSVSSGELVLSIPILTSMYNGTIKHWNHTSIQDLNPGVNLPDEKIIVVARSDKSGTTSIFTSGLSTDDHWARAYGSFSKPTDWAENVISFHGHKNRGMSGLILSFPYSIGYMSIADAVTASVPYAKLQNSYGNIIEANTESVQASMDKASEHFVTASELTDTLTKYSDGNSYPIAGFTYMIVYMSTMFDCKVALELVRFIDWITTSDDAAKGCIEASMTPLSKPLANVVRKTIMMKMTCDGENIWDRALQQIKDETRADNTLLISVSSVTTILVVLICAGVGGVFIHRHIKLINKLKLNEWQIDIEDVLFYHTAANDDDEHRFVMWPSLSSLTEVDDVDDGFAMMNNVLHWPGKWQGITIGLRLMELKSINSLPLRLKKKLLLYRDMEHNNLLTFFGITTIDQKYYTVNEYCSRGSLRDIIQEQKLSMTTDFKYTLVLDAASGLAHLHKNKIIHGHLTSINCMLDTKWTLKIADWEFTTLYQIVDTGKSSLFYTHKGAEDMTDIDAAWDEFWTAPELMKSEFAHHPTQESDVYSMAVIAHEIFTHEMPYVEHYEAMSVPEILRAVVQNNLRPCENEATPNSIRSVMENAWSEDPQKRPTSSEFVKSIRNCHNFKKGVIDIIMEAVEDNTQKLKHDLKVARKNANYSRNMLNKLVQRNVPPAFVSIVSEKLSKWNKNNAKTRREKHSYMVSKDASVLCVKCSYEENDRNLWTIYNNLDMLIENFLQLYGGNRVDIGTGLFLVVFHDQEPDWELPGPSTARHRRKSSITSCKTQQSDMISVSNMSHFSDVESTFTHTTTTVSHQQEDRPKRELAHAQAAAEFALSVQQFSEDLFTNSDGQLAGGFLVSVHTGPIHMCLLDNDIPKCMYIGSTIDTVIHMVAMSTTETVLASHQFASRLEEDHPLEYQLIPEKRINGEFCVYYWLSRRPPPQAPVHAPIREVTIPVLV